MSTQRIPHMVTNLMKRSSLGILATCSQAGQPHSAVVFYYYYPTEETIYFFKARTTRTVRNIRENPKVAVTIDQPDLLDPMRNFGVMLRGIAIHIKEDEGINRVLEDLLHKKYHSLPKDPQELKKDYEWLVPPERQCFRIEISTMTWWRGPYFGKARLRASKVSTK